MRKLALTAAPSVALTLLALLVLASGANALTIDSGNSGLDIASGCADSGCFTPLYEDLTSSGTVSGTVEIIGSTLSFDILLDGANLAATGGDGPVTSIDFQNFNYVGSIGVTLDASNNYIVGGGQTATVSGTVLANGAGSAGSVAGNTVLVTGLCSGSPGTDLQCGLIFGPLLDFSADVNGNTRYFQHSLDVFAAIPEPGTALLLGLGLAGLTARRRD